MKVAIIPPTKYLEKFAHHNKNRYHLALAHRVLSDQKYAAFYRKCSENREYVILDNGACELGQSIEFSKLLRAIKLVGASQIVLPDTLHDTDTTLEQTSAFLDKLLQSNADIRTMAVVQGKTKDDWMRCFLAYCSNPYISTIGISSTEAMFSSLDFDFSRVRTIDLLDKRNLIPKNKYIHLLGLPGSGHLELGKLKKYPFIEGADTSAPVVHGFYGVVFRHGIGYNKIPRYLPPDMILNDRQIKDVIYNISVLFDCAK